MEKIHISVTTGSLSMKFLWDTLHMYTNLQKISHKYPYAMNEKASKALSG